MGFWSLGEWSVLLVASSPQYARSPTQTQSHTHARVHTRHSTRPGSTMYCHPTRHFVRWIVTDGRHGCSLRNAQRDGHDKTHRNLRGTRQNYDDTHRSATAAVWRRPCDQFRRARPCSASSEPQSRPQLPRLRHIPVASEPPSRGNRKSRRIQRRGTVAKRWKSPFESVRVMCPAMVVARSIRSQRWPLPPPLPPTDGM